jgi:hypothetical protein
MIEAADPVFLKRVEIALLYPLAALVLILVANRIVRAFRGSDDGFVRGKAWIALYVVAAVAGGGACSIEKALEHRYRRLVLSPLLGDPQNARLFVDGVPAKEATAIVAALRRIRDDSWGRTFGPPFRVDVLAGTRSVEMTLQKRLWYGDDYRVSVPLGAGNANESQIIGMISTPMFARYGK